MKRFFKALLIVLALVAIQAAVAHAYQLDEAYRPNNSPFTTVGTDPSGSLIRILQIISGGLLFFAAPLATIMLIFIGINMNMKGADSENIEQQKKNITWLLAGLFLIIISYTFVRFVISVAVGAANDTATPSSAIPITYIESQAPNYLLQS